MWSEISGERTDPLTSAKQSALNADCSRIGCAAHINGFYAFRITLSEMDGY